MSKRWQQIERLYHTALELTSRERSAFLDEACAGDESLRREVESLLASHDQAVSFIESPPDDIAAGMIADEQARSMIGRMLGHYKLHSLLGQGGMGEVYRAHDTRLDRDVAVKILPEHLASNREALWRFEREAKAVAALSHPNILAIHDFGTEQGISYTVTELLEGETLRTSLTGSSPGWRRAAEIGLAIAEGLAAAHAKGIIHRDLKPENIFLTADGQVKILDFGIARVKREVLPDAETLASLPDTTRPGTIIGTIGYMSPEQVRGEAADAPSDIFSLGCVLYEMVSSNRPFARTTAAETIAAILKEEPPALTEVNKEVPKALAQVSNHCLKKKPGERYQSARELALELKAILSERGISRSVPSPARLHRRPLVWVAAGSVGLCLVMAAWLYLYFGRGRSIDSIAVLPLVNMSGDANLEYLSDGITESLINSLSQLPQLRVMARGTVFSYKGKEIDPRKVGEELKVRSVFTGKMVHRGDTLSIQADLVNAIDGSLLWGERYDRKLPDLVAIQEEIARQISEKLRLRLTGADQKRLTKHHTDNIEAHQLYLKGRYYWGKFNEEGLKKSIEFYKQATDQDPNYALAYAGMADSYYFMSNLYLPSIEAMPRSRAAAMKALQIDETLAEAHAALAAVKTWYDWNWEEGERAYKRAIELNPSYASVHNLYGLLMVALERFDEAQVEMNRARELDPLSPYIHVGTVWPALISRRYDQAIEQLRRIVALNPDFANAHLSLAWAYEGKEMYEAAIAAARQAKSFDNSWVNSASLGHIYALARRHAEARNELDELRKRAGSEHISDYGFAIIHAGLGEHDLAFAALERAYKVRDEYMPLVKVFPLFDGLRSDPRFADLLRRMKLAP